MKISEEVFDKIYNELWNVYSEWIHLAPEENSNWPVERYRKYDFGPVIGMYRELVEKNL